MKFLNSGLQKPTNEQLAQMKNSGGDAYYVFVKYENKKTIYSLLYIAVESSPTLFFTDNRLNKVFAYRFNDGKWYIVNTVENIDGVEYTDDIEFDEIGTTVFSGSYAKSISQDKNFVLGCYLTSPKKIKLDIAEKYSELDFVVVPNLQNKIVRKNGNYVADDGYMGLNSITVELPTSDTVKLQDLEVTPTKEQQSFYASSEYDGFNNVIVNAIPDSLVEPNYQEITVTPNKSLQEVTYDSSEGFNALSKVFVEAVPTQDTPTFTKNDIYRPNEGEFFDEVKVNVQPNLQTQTVTPTTSEQTIIADSNYDGLSEVIVEAIETETKTITENGKYYSTKGKFINEINVNVFQLDTSDATATASEIFIAKTAYVDGEKVVGEFTIDAELTEQNNLLEDIEALLKTKIGGIVPTGTIEITENDTYNVNDYEFANVNVQPKLQDKTIEKNEAVNETVTADEGYDGLNSVTVKVQPSLQEIETSASETQQDIVADEGFYGLSKVSIAPATLGTKAVSPTTTAQTITPDSDDYGLKEVNISAVTADIDENIVSTNIVKGVSILGVEGEYEPLLQEKTVDEFASTIDTVVTPDEGYDGLSKVTVSAIKLQSKTVDPSTETQYVRKDDGYVGLWQVVVNPVVLQDKTVSPSESTQTITADEGAFALGTVTVNSAPLQNKTVTPTTSEQTVNPDSNYYGLNGVTVEAIQTETATITENGTYTPTSGKYYNSVTVNVEGSGSTEGKQKITVIDYDGTILEEAYVAEGDTYTLPDSSYVEGLVFQKWACPIEIVDNQITVEDYPVTIAPIYSSGYTTITVELTKATGLTVNLKNITIGYLTWGDGASSGGGTSFSHTYSDYGTYTIQIVSGGTTFGEYVFGQTSAAHNFYVKSINLAKNVTSIGNYAFRYCESLETLTIPTLVTSIGLYACEYCYNLKTAIIPASVQNLYSYAFQYTWGGLKYAVLDYGITSISNYVFNYATSIKELIIPDTATVGNYVVGSCMSLETIKLPTGYSSSSSTTPFGSNLSALKTIILKNATMTTLGGSILSNAYSLEKFDIPSSVTTINYSAFNNCYALEKLVIPSGVTKINSSTFYNCKSLKRIDFSNHTSVPTLTSSTEFNTANKLLKIVVPNGLKNEWIAATNWSNFTNYIYSVREAGIL